MTMAWMTGAGLLASVNAALAPGRWRVLQTAGLHAVPAASGMSRVDLRAPRMRRGMRRAG